jgi:circadian clock protein KaiB
MPDNYELTIIDVLEQPGLAEESKIIATPTLIKEWPLPIRRVLGDLSNQEKLLEALGIYLQSQRE